VRERSDGTKWVLISWFFSSYLINRQTQYILNYFISSFFKADVSIGQRFILSSILSAFYIAFIFHIFKKRTKNLLTPILVSILLFVDNRLFVFQEKSYKKFNTTLFYSYNIISSLFNHFWTWQIKSLLFLKINKKYQSTSTRFETFRRFFTQTKRYIVISSVFLWQETLFSSTHSLLCQ